MPRFEVTTTVVYSYDVEADNVEEAEKQGFDYEDYQHHGTVESIEVYEYEEEDDEEQDS